MVINNQHNSAVRHSSHVSESSTIRVRASLSAYLYAPLPIAVMPLSSSVYDAPGKPEELRAAARLHLHFYGTLNSRYLLQTLILISPHPAFPAKCQPECRTRKKLPCQVTSPAQAIHTSRQQVLCNHGIRHPAWAPNVLGRCGTP